MRLIIPSIISKHTLLDVNGLKSDRVLYKVWHIAAKLSHETNLAITKLSLSLIHNTIGLGLPMFINAATRQQISIYSIGPYWYLLDCTTTFGKVGYKFFFRSLRSRIWFCTPTLKSAALPLATTHCYRKTILQFAILLRCNDSCTAVIGDCSTVQFHSLRCYLIDVLDRWSSISSCVSF